MWTVNQCLIGFIIILFLLSLLLLLLLLQSNNSNQDQGAGVRPDRRGQSPQCECDTSQSEEQQRKPRVTLQTVVGGTETVPASGAAQRWTRPSSGGSSLWISLLVLALIFQKISKNLFFFGYVIRYIQGRSSV